MARPYAIILDPEAARDLECIYAYISEDQPKNAARFIRQLHKQIRTLTKFPRRNPLAPEQAHITEEVRHLIHGNYRIIYAVFDHRVHILCVRHAARLPLNPENE